MPDERQELGDVGGTRRPDRRPGGPLPRLRASRPAAAGAVDRGPRRRDGPARPGGAPHGRVPQAPRARPWHALLGLLPPAARAVLGAGARLIPPLAEWLTEHWFDLGR